MFGQNVRMVRPILLGIMILTLILTACASQSGTPPQPKETKSTAPATPDKAAAEAFYKGKTVTIVVGSTPGGGYDQYGRLLSRHLGKYIPGNPTVIVENVPEAGGISAMNQLYNTKPKDGTVIGIAPALVAISQLVGQDGVNYDAAKFNWLGNLNYETDVCVVRADTGISKFEDLLTKPVKIGSNSTTSTNGVYPALLNAVLGTKFEIVYGYSGTSEINIALERNEVQGRCGWSWGSIKTTRFDLFQDGTLKVIVQTTMRPSSELAGVPSALDYAKDERSKTLLQAAFAAEGGRMVVAPPGMQPERLAVLRDAFWQVVNDPNFKADADKSKLETNVAGWQEIQNLIETTMKTPKDVADILTKYFKPSK